MESENSDGGVNEPAAAAPARSDGLLQAGPPLAASRPSYVPRATRSPAVLVTPGRASRAFARKHFPDVSLELWNDWRWQLRNRFTTARQLSRVMTLTDDERAALARLRGMPVAVTPYYASLVASGDASHPLRRSVVPTCAEFVTSDGEADDPLGEDDMSPTPGLVHRYPDRVLFLVTGKCSVNCRYCTRSRVVAHGHLKPDRERWDRAIAYVAGHPEVRDVLVSGGDPLTMSNHRLEYLLSRLRRIRHVEIIRIGTKAPVVLPQRVTSRLTRMLNRFHPLWFSIHFTHPDEITPEVARACGALADAGVPLGSQTVLLKGVNDDVDTMRRLVHALLRVRVRPYYLYQCDPITGSAHFRTPVTKGVEIIRQLRGHTTGYAVPTYVIDAPGGGGKIPIGPQYVTAHEDGHVIMRNYRGDEYRYPDAPA